MSFHTAEAMYGDMELFSKTPREGRFFAPIEPGTVSWKEKTAYTLNVTDRLEWVRETLLETLNKPGVEFLGTPAWKEKREGMRYAEVSLEEFAVTRELSRYYMKAANAIGVSKFESFPLRDYPHAIADAVARREAKEHENHARDWDTLNNELARTDIERALAGVPSELGAFLNDLPVDQRDFVSSAYRMVNEIRSERISLTGKAHKSRITPEDIRSMRTSAIKMLDTLQRLSSELSIQKRFSMAEKVKEHSGKSKIESLTALVAIRNTVLASFDSVNRMEKILARCEERAAKITAKNSAMAKADDFIDLAHEVSELVSAQRNKLEGYPQRGKKGYHMPNFSDAEHTELVKEEGRKFLTILDGMVVQFAKTLTLADFGGVIEQRKAA